MKMESEATLMITDNNSKSVHQDLINYYCDISVNNVCRVCLEKCQPHKKMLNIFETKQKHLPSEVSTMIMACASIQVTVLHLLFISIKAISPFADYGRRRLTQHDLQSLLFKIKRSLAI